MLAKFKKLKWPSASKEFKWELKVIKKSKDWKVIYLENWYYYPAWELELKKESWWARNKKPKQEIVEYKKEETVKIDLWRVNMELKVWEYETRIKQLSKECESWMEDFNDAKKEKLEFEHKYNEELVKNESLSKRISMLVDRKDNINNKLNNHISKLIISENKKDMWKTLFLINVTIDIVYLLIKYLWI